MLKNGGGGPVYRGQTSLDTFLDKDIWRIKMEIGKPVKRYTVVPLESPIPATAPPDKKHVPEHKPEREPEKVPA